MQSMTLLDTKIVNVISNIVDSIKSLYTCAHLGLVQIYRREHFNITMNDCAAFDFSVAKLVFRAIQHSCFKCIFDIRSVYFLCQISKERGNVLVAEKHVR